MKYHENGIGASVKRREDLRFITGRGRYTDDIVLHRQSYAYILRSPHAHAKINAINTDLATASNGVIAIFTGNDLECGSIPCGWLVKNIDGSDMNEPPHPPLAKEKVRYVGDQVAVVIAESLAQAKMAAEKIEVDYEILDAVVNMEKAIAEGSELIHTEAPQNLCFDWGLGEEADIDATLSNSKHQVKMRLTNNRLIPNAMEPRCAIAQYDASADSYTLYTTTQNPHLIRLLMGAFVLQIPEHKLHIISPDVGGGFGSKIYHYAEEAIVTWASQKIRRPVKWVSDRTEAFLTDAHGRDHISDVILGLDENYKFTALKVETKANVGAYLSTFSTCVPTYLYATLLAGVYTTPKIYCNVKTIFTNTAPVDAYRGAGRPEATYLLERLVDRAARQLGIDRIDIRRRNFIPADAFPYQTPVALQYDSGNYQESLERALQDSDWDGFASRKEEASKNGKLRGIGISTYIEACGIAPSAVVGSLGCRAGLFEAASVRVNPTGSVSVFTGSHSHGQGHETTFAQVVAHQLGIPIENVDIVHGDTTKIPFGMGTYGSRSLSVGGEAIVRALNKIISKAKQIAAHIMETDVVDIEFESGSFTVKGTDKSMAFAEIALAAYIPHNFPHKSSHDDESGLEPGLEEHAFYDPLNFTYPAGCHICEVEINPETGKVNIVKFTAVDDVGKIVNPMIVDGQIRGGIAQGIGQALLEQAVYDDNGQLITGSFMDYTMPRAADIPLMHISNTVTACAHNSLGVKGCGEVGAIGSPPAIINAVLDALSVKGVNDIAMPTTPYRVWQAIQDAR